MTDSYQAIYDAVRSKISGGDIGQAVRDVLSQSFDVSHQKYIIQEAACAAFHEMQRPFVLLRPSMSADGDKWCALYGKDLQSGVAGSGDTPAQAAANFDLAWWGARTPAAIISAGKEGAK